MYQLQSGDRKGSTDYHIYSAYENISFDKNYLSSQESASSSDFPDTSSQNAK